MSPVKAALANQHVVLHQHWPPPDCCLCNAEAKLKEAEAKLAKIEPVLRAAVEAARAKAEFDGAVLNQEDPAVVAPALVRHMTAGDALVDAVRAAGLS